MFQVGASEPKIDCFVSVHITAACVGKILFAIVIALFTQNKTQITSLISRHCVAHFNDDEVVVVLCRRVFRTPCKKEII